MVYHNWYFIKLRKLHLNKNKCYYQFDSPHAIIQNKCTTILIIQMLYIIGLPKKIYNKNDMSSQCNNI
jgi:hypothetical protein